ncbi:MAG: extracellular solute-binding protein [Clostridiales bacterium]|jgi:ABC-type glycerol-3-phosphate transport system substrate-binding protein|nr:extracellular solute-binding protein [Clostridiales bacterium]
MKIKTARFLAMAFAAIMLVSACGSAGGAGTVGGADAAEERVTLRVFSTDAGITIPQGVNTSDNPYVNIAKEYANVDVNYEIVPWGDMQTRTNLLLASGDYPDIVHTAYNDNVESAEDAGGFLNLLPYFENSPVVQSFINKDEYLKYGSNTKTGEYYAIPMSAKEFPEGRNFLVRYDLFQQYAGGVFPSSIEGWVEVARKLKADRPNSKPFSVWNAGSSIFNYADMFWEAYGINIHTGIMQPPTGDGTFVFTFQRPAFIEAAKFHKMLYDEGLLSKTWITNTDISTFNDDWRNSDVLLIADNCQQSELYLAREPLWVLVPPLTEYPVPAEEANPNNTKRLSSMDLGHRVHISASSKYPDQAWKFIEGLCSPELYDLIFWGEEGVSYSQNADGSRDIIPEGFNDPDRAYGLVYGFIFGYGSGLEAARAARRGAVDPQEGYFEAIEITLDSIDKVAKTLKTPFESASVVADLISDDIRAKADEMLAEQSSIVSEYIMGVIDDAQFEARIADYTAKWAYYLDAYNQAYTDRVINKIK